MPLPTYQGQLTNGFAPQAGFANSNPNTQPSNLPNQSPVASNYTPSPSYLGYMDYSSNPNGVYVQQGNNGSVNNVSTTTMGNGNKIDQVPSIVNKTNQLSQTGITTNPQTGTANYANGEIHNPEPAPTQANQNVGISNGGFVGDTYYPPGAHLPQDSNGNYVTTSSNSPADQQIMDNLNKQKAQVDATTASVISNIQSQYDDLIQQQKQANVSQQKSISATLLSSGSSQHAGISSAGITAATLSYGLQKIRTLNDQEKSAITTAQQAGQNQDFQLMDKMNAEIASIRDQKVAAATKLSDQVVAATQKLADQNYQAEKDKNSKISEIALEAAKNGADPKTVSAISNAKDVQGAITVAGGSLQTASGQLGDYLQYKRDTAVQGLVPTDYTTWKAKDDARQAKQKANEAYSSAYASASGKAAAEGASGTSDKTQQKLEQQYRQVLSKEFSARTGALGVENAKVNQANHLNSLLTQYFDPKTGNYNVPKSQYAELVLGLASLVSPSGTTSEGERAEIKSKTARGDLNGALQYITGVPQNGNTQAIIKNLVDSIDRQAETATTNREAALQNMRDQAPTDLEQSRIDALNKSTEMVRYAGENRIAKSHVDNYIKTNPKEAENIAKLYEIPGATDTKIEAYLKAQGKIY